MNKEKINEISSKKHRKEKFKESFEELILRLRKLLEFCYHEITLVCLFFAMILFTITTESHINLIVKLTVTKIGFPMFGFVFMSVVNFLASLAFSKKRTLLSALVVILISSIVIYFGLNFMSLARADQYYKNNIDLANKSFLIIISGIILTVMGIVLGFVFSLINQKKHPKQRILLRSDKNTGI